MTSVTCPKCGWTSFNPNDITRSYCGHCHQFHDIPVEGGDAPGTSLTPESSKAAPTVQPARAAGEIARLRKELLEAKHKNYTDYREYVGLLSQNESLRRQVDELKRQVSDLLREINELEHRKSDGRMDLDTDN